MLHLASELIYFLFLVKNHTNGLTSTDLFYIVPAARKKVSCLKPPLRKYSSCSFQVLPYFSQLHL